MSMPFCRSTATITSIVLACACGVLAVDGTAVSIAYRYSGVGRYNSDPNIKLVPEGSTGLGKLIRVVVRNNVPISCDTLSPYLGRSALISFDGTQAAFFRTNQKFENGRLVGIDGLWYLTVMNIDGSNPRDIVPTEAIGQCKADWPATGWIYFEHRSKGWIWRVNPGIPGSLDSVYNYLPADTNDRNEMRKWSCSADARFAVGHFAGGLWSGEYAHCFPPAVVKECALTGSSDNLNGCNVALSASGRLMCSYYGTGHYFTEISRYIPSPISVVKFKRLMLDTVDSWIGSGHNWPLTSTGAGMEDPRWATNSDKWLLQQVSYLGHAGELMPGGTNAVYTNWKERQAFMLTNNPDNSVDAGATTISYCSTAGDFWVVGPSGSYEDSAGTWVALDGATASAAPAISGRAQRRDAGMKVVGLSRITPPQGARSLAMYDLRGKSLWRIPVTTGSEIRVPRPESVGIIVAQ